MPVPKNPKIYHIFHVDRLPSILKSGCLWCDAEVNRQTLPGTTVGMNNIKNRRLNELTLTSHPHLFVGDCVPFYFCPRSVMLYIIYAQSNIDLKYRGGQDPIIHLEANLFKVVSWASKNDQSWAFTSSNAGSRYFEDYCDLAQLDKIDWDSVNATNWSECKDGKQAEFLIENSFPFELVDRIGVYNERIRKNVLDILVTSQFNPVVEVKRDWYY